MLNENLTKSADTASLLLSDLRESLKHASPAEALLILDAIATAAQLANRIAALRDAIRSN